jgi:hypothetical protein
VLLRTMAVDCPPMLAQIRDVGGIHLPRLSPAKV